MLAEETLGAMYESAGGHFEGYEVQQLPSEWENDLFTLFGIFTYTPPTPATSRGPLQFISSLQSPNSQFKKLTDENFLRRLDMYHTHNKSFVHCTPKTCLQIWRHYTVHTAPSRVSSRPLTAHRTPASTPCGFNFVYWHKKYLILRGHVCNCNRT